MFLPQVRWGTESLDGYLTFFSVSEDGHVRNWTIVNQQLRYEDVFSVKINKELYNLETKDEKMEDCCTAMSSLKADDPTLFLVGTAEGLVHLSTSQFSSHYLATYVAHPAPIYKIEWSPFQPDIFITSAADRMIKIWDKDSQTPLFVFNLAVDVGDVTWAPYSSTIFAVATLDCRVHLYDLDVDRNRPVCVQHVVAKRKARLNHLSFNSQDPVMIVGDSFGEVTCLKLSPNLRRQALMLKAFPGSENWSRTKIAEKKKLKRILEQVKTEEKEE